MGSFFAAVVVAVVALAIGQSLLRRRMNPYAEVPYGELPEALRTEVARVLPGFSPDIARITKQGDRARLAGDFRSGTVVVEADFDARGDLVDFEVDTRTGVRRIGPVDAGDLPNATRIEIDRVLGPHRADFTPRRVFQGALSDGERAFEMKGDAGEWRWEIEVSATGRLLEVEMEKRRR